MEMPDLLPCPFCGETKLSRNIGFDYYYIHCKTCNASGRDEENEDVSVQKWNTRADNAILKAKDARIAELEEFINKTHPYPKG